MPPRTTPVAWRSANAAPGSPRWPASRRDAPYPAAIPNTTRVAVTTARSLVSQTACSGVIAPLTSPPPAAETVRRALRNWRIDRSWRTPETAARPRPPRGARAHRASLSIPDARAATTVQHRRQRRERFALGSPAGDQHEGPLEGAKRHQCGGHVGGLRIVDPDDAAHLASRPPPMRQPAKAGERAGYGVGGEAGRVPPARRP